ncbi:MAG TPA: ribonuclease Y [Actinobacteria bacterium]|nr:ribonuclease Y [Actinomycetota bacterium]
MKINVSILLIAVAAVAMGVVVGFFVRKYLAEAKITSAEAAARRVLEEAKKETERIKREALVEAKDEIHAMRAEAERESREWRNEIQRMEKRLSQKEELLDSKNLALEKQEKTLESKEAELEKVKSELEEVYTEQKRMLEKLAGLSATEAKELLLKRIEEEVRHDAAKLVREIESQAREEGEKRARNIISLAIQRCASDHVAETTVSVVPLPNDEMKGRIIGREGRNIRAFENLTGINLIIDDTPEAVILSSFDPVRRETARLTLEKLISDGRIHPARIEEMYEKSKGEVETEIREVGEQAAFEIGIHNLHPGLVRVMGQLKFRSSYGQNVLKHSLEVAHLAGVMAAELNVDAKLAKRAGLLHDIGKAIDHEVEGPHAIIGADLAKRLRESTQICHAIEAHHGEVEPRTIEAVLIQAADAISASRPGARRETLESYIKRLEKLESIAESYKGVEKSYAMQAGREIRIMVKPEELNDEESAILARDIAKKIEEELEYPGQIKVTVIRENRAVEYAK